MVAPRLQAGESDPVSYTCRCPAKGNGGGNVLLFYRYFANSPPLPGYLVPSSNDIRELAEWHGAITSGLAITGKIRIAHEGFNVTVGGTREAIELYIEGCRNHWSFKGIPLSTQAEQTAFFKPSPGCACVFQPATTASIRVCAEITPLGITNYTPLSWDVVEELLPAEFHRRCLEEDIELLDLRNHYESRIGYFVDPKTGQHATLPQIRRFSQLPQLVKSGRLSRRSVDTGIDERKKQVLTYCTGGIRCEKATRWMAEMEQDDQKICTLKGGIQAYLDWMDAEIAAGHKSPMDSLFKGKNYVFDARGVVGLRATRVSTPVSQCHVCQNPEDRLSKCKSPACHLVLVICEACEDTDPRCCQSCRDTAQALLQGASPQTKEMCECEKLRELELWGGEETRIAKTQGWRKARRETRGSNTASKLRAS